MQAGATIYSFASLTLYNSQINMYKTSIIELDGLYSGLNTTIYCDSDTVCWIICDGLGCYGVNQVTGGGLAHQDCESNIIANNICDNQLPFIDELIEQEGNGSLLNVIPIINMNTAVDGIFDESNYDTRFICDATINADII